jgi:hypothetical protein
MSPVRKSGVNFIFFSLRARSAPQCMALRDIAQRSVVCTSDQASRGTVPLQAGGNSGQTLDGATATGTGQGRQQGSQHWPAEPPAGGDCNQHRPGAMTPSESPALGFGGVAPLPSSVPSPQFLVTSWRWIAHRCVAKRADVALCARLRMGRAFAWRQAHPTLNSRYFLVHAGLE